MEDDFIFIPRLLSRF